MRHLLETWGHVVLMAASLDEAVERARQRPGIDLLFTDHRLPHGATGIETVDAVRAVLGREIKAAIITGDTSPTTLRRIQARGLRLLHKPLDDEHLRELLIGRPSRGSSKYVCRSAFDPEADFTLLGCAARKQPLGCMRLLGGAPGALLKRPSREAPAGNGTPVGPIRLPEQ